MKFANPVGWLLTAMMALTLGTVGCKKNPDRLTKIDGMGPTARVGNEPEAPPINNVPPLRNVPGTETGPITSVPVNKEGFPAGLGHPGWIENRSEFAAQTVYFDFDKSTIKPSEVSKLEEVARRMKTMRGKALKVEGHCDERGTEEYNRSLGDKRALAIREWLVTHGLVADDIDTISFGEDKPADTAHNDAAYTKNRRGELILLSPPGAN